MYSGDFRIKLFLSVFLSIGTVEEILILTGHNDSIASLPYTILIFYIIINYDKYSEGKYLWDAAFPIVGLFSLLELISYLTEFHYGFFRKMDSIVSLMVWLKCIIYLENYDSNEIKDEEDESI